MRNTHVARLSCDPVSVYLCDGGGFDSSISRPGLFFYDDLVSSAIKPIAPVLGVVLNAIINEPSTCISCIIQNVPLISFGISNILSFACSVIAMLYLSTRQKRCFHLATEFYGEDPLPVFDRSFCVLPYRY